MEGMVVGKGSILCPTLSKTLKWPFLRDMSLLLGCRTGTMDQATWSSMPLFSVAACCCYMPYHGVLCLAFLCVCLKYMFIHPFLFIFYFSFVDKWRDKHILNNA